MKEGILETKGESTVSKKLSQSEIDALVNSLLVSDAGDSSADADAPAEPEPAAAPQPAAAQAASSFDAIQDLGPITQAEVDAATAAYQVRKDDGAATMQAPTPVETAPSVLAATPSPAPAVQPVPAPAPQPANRPPVAKPVLSVAAAGGALMDIELTVSVELGRTRLTLRDILNLGPGSVITLDKLAGDRVDVLVNRVPIMKAEVLAIGEKYGIRVTESNLNGEANTTVRAAS